MLEKFNVKHDPQLSGGLPLYQRIMELLKHHGKMTIVEISAELNNPEGSVKTTLYGYKDIFIQVGNHQWGVKAR